MFFLYICYELIWRPYALQNLSNAQIKDPDALHCCMDALDWCFKALMLIENQQKCCMLRLLRNTLSFGSNTLNNTLDALTNNSNVLKEGTDALTQLFSVPTMLVLHQKWFDKWGYAPQWAPKMCAGKVVWWNRKYEFKTSPHTNGTLGASYGVIWNNSTSQGMFHCSLSHKTPQANAFAPRSLSKVT